MGTPTPVTFRQMFELLGGVPDDAPLVKQITLYRAGEIGAAPTVRIDADDPASARQWRDALHLDGPREFGQPQPLNAVEPDVWAGTIVGDLSGWKVHVHHQEPYTAEHEARWVADGGPERHPRTGSGEVPDA